MTPIICFMSRLLAKSRLNAIQACVRFLIGGKRNVVHPAIPITIEDIGLAEAIGLVERARQHRVSSLTNPGFGGVRINTGHPQCDTRAPAFRAGNEAGKWMILVGVARMQHSLTEAAV